MTLVLPFVKVSRARGKEGLGERWALEELAPTRNCLDVGDARSQECIVSIDNQKLGMALKTSLTIRVHKCKDNNQSPITFEHHGQDSRVKCLVQDLCPTVGSRESNSLGPTGNAVLVLENNINLNNGIKVHTD